MPPPLDPRLGGRARALLEPLLQGADGLLDTGHYGAAWREGKPDIVAFLGHVSAGFVVLNGVDDDSTIWLLENFTVEKPPESEDQPFADHGALLVLPLANEWLMATIPVWSQITQQAARDDILIQASYDIGELNAVMRDAHAHGRHSHEGHDHPLSEIIDRTVGRQITSVNLQELLDYPEKIAEMVREMIGELDREGTFGLRAEPTGGKASERFKDVQWENNPVFEEAIETQVRIAESLLPFYSTQDGYYGAVPQELFESGLLTPSHAHVHAMPTTENGFVYLHASNVDDSLGVAFIAQILCMSRHGLPPLAHPLGFVTGPNTARLTNVAGVSVAIWPFALRVAEACGILVYQGKCPDEDDNDDEGAPSPTPIRPDFIPV